MLKSLGFVITLLLSQIAPLQPQTEDHSSNHQENAKTEQRPKENPIVINNIDNHQSCDKCQAKDGTSTSEAERIAWLGIKINLILAAFTLVIAGATIWQASSARLAAKAVVNVERPWFVVTIKVLSETESESGGIPYEVRATNHGNTPAVFFGGDYDMALHPSGFSPPKDFVSPMFAPIQTFFVKSDGFDIWRSWTDSSASLQGRILEDPPKYFYVYGRMFYKDTFTDYRDPRNKPHETRFVFMYDAFQKRFSRGEGDYAQNT
jgi:hypothetical protein